MILQNKDTVYRPVRVVVWDKFRGKSTNNAGLGSIWTKNAGLPVEEWAGIILTNGTAYNSKKK